VKRSDEEKLRASLAAAINVWWDADKIGATATGVPLPYVGEDTFTQMANAAAAVLIGIADAQETAQRDGMWKEDV
jgi:hypothetical protein